jgi:hypothetical protein
LDCRGLFATRRDPGVGACTTRADFGDGFSGVGDCEFSTLYILMCLLWIIVCLIVMHKCFMGLFGVSGRLGQSSYVVLYGL